MAFAQCAPQWLPGQPTPGTSGPVYTSTLWDQDGAGPLPPVAVLAGNFAAAGATPVNNIVAFDPTTGAFAPLGSGLAYTASAAVVRTVATAANGDLVALGSFSLAGGGVASGAARWNGSTWAPLGAGFTGGQTPYVVVGMPNGDLVAGGDFTFAGGVPANYVARWNGLAWQPLGSGMSSYVYALLVMPNGDLIAGGQFTTAGGAPINGIARWNGTSWLPIGSGLPGSVRSLALMPNGDIVAGGVFSVGGVTAAVARWNGTSWTSLGAVTYAAPLQRTVGALQPLPNGDLIAGGVFDTIGGVPASFVARWSGGSWSPLASGTNGQVFSLTLLPNGDVLAGGIFSTAGSADVSSAARWNGSSWSPLVAGTVGAVYAFATAGNGDLLVTGVFGSIAGVHAGGVARRTAAGWVGFGDLRRGTFAGVGQAIAALPNGDVVVAGSFDHVGSVAASNIARWNGTAWAPIGTGVSDAVGALAVMPNGDLVAGGAFLTAGGTTVNGIARWNGTTWSGFGSGMGSGFSYLNALLVLSNGNLIAAGNFQTAGGVPAIGIARWNGSAWSPLGGGVPNIVNTILELGNGDIVVGGGFFSAGSVNANRVARWNGSAWSPLGAGLIGGTSSAVLGLALLPGGDLVAVGGFVASNGVPMRGVARWDGATWSGFGSGTDQTARAVCMQPDGRLAVGGEFVIVDGSVAAAFAELGSTCPATVVSSGTGCVGSAGLQQLAAPALPWAGSTFTALATGMPAQSLAVGVLGLTAGSVPLSALLAQGVAGCDLLVSPDVLLTSLPAGGTASVALAIPNTPTLAGALFRAQVVALEFGAAANLIAATSTNALAVTIGVF